jgi:hypothetical protein
MFSGRFRSNKAQKKIRLKAENPNPTHYKLGTGKTGKSGFRIFYPESGPNVPDSPDFLIKLHKPARISDRIFPDLVIKLWKPDSGFCIFAPDPGKILSCAGPYYKLVEN